MGRNKTETALKFIEKTGYTGKISKEAMGKELWNEYCKITVHNRWTKPEYVMLKEERKAERRSKHIETLKQKKESGAYLSSYCKDDITKIENYELAKKDNFEGWCCHHRLETHTSDGERRLVDISAKELVALDMYYCRPAEELILMTTKEHRRLHQCVKK